MAARSIVEPTVSEFERGTGTRAWQTAPVRRERSVFDGAIQVAGVIDRTEADLLVACGVEWLGIPLRLDVHREDLSDADAAAIVRSLPPRVRAVLITYLADAEAIRALAAALGIAAVQLHVPVARSEIARLRAIAPGLLVIKSLVVRPDNADALVDAVAELAPHVDAFITDTFDPATGASGATGRTHDWAVSARLALVSPRPVILAGGLSPANVAAAIASVRPAGVDVHTGVEGPDGRKRRDLVEAFVAAARGMWAAR
jgi:phosphoribosylanthranilate isomerase